MLQILTCYGFTYFPLLCDNAVATAFKLAKSSSRTEPVITAAATASTQAAGANTTAAGLALAATAAKSVEQGVADVFAASQASCVTS
jgi:hypothetical protein